MIIKFILDTTKEKMDQLDGMLFDFNMDEYVWWEQNYTVMATDSAEVADDIEKILVQGGISFTKNVEE